MSQHKTKFVCRYCGSDNVSKEGLVDWDAETQSWVVRAIYDNGYCHDCETEQDYFNVETIEESNNVAA